MDQRLSFPTPTNNIDEKPTVIRHAGTPKQRQKHTINLDTRHICYIGFGSNREYGVDCEIN